MNAHYRQLTQSQRYQIESGLASGMALAGIAKQIAVHTSTASRELDVTALEAVTRLSKLATNAMTGIAMHASTVSLERG